MSRSSEAKGFWQRNGDAAEQTFLAFAKHKGFHVERYGFDRTPLPHFHTLPAVVRSTPDYVVTSKRTHDGFLVECKAGGNGSVVNVKKHDLMQLTAWAKIGSLFIFFNDSKNKRIAFVPWSHIEEVITTHRDDVREGVWESDNVAFLAIPKRFFDWIDYDEFKQ